ncbi:hypothetical protein JHK87_055964 [Glycine soja]|nr:hypothetical protein JHK87_055964 [Glycine soja]
MLRELEKRWVNHKIMAEECLKREKDRVAHYLHSSSEPKLLEVFVQKVIELQDKYLAYVNDCFQNHTLFYKALKEAFEVVELLAYISDKDLFAEFYRKKLARRLLFDKSANDDHERCILTKLKQQYGGQFTSKMEGMVNHF